MSSVKEDIRRTQINSAIGMLFVGSFALWAGILIWESSFGYNPLARAFEKHYEPIEQALQE